MVVYVVTTRITSRKAETDPDITLEFQVFQCMDFDFFFLTIKYVSTIIHPLRDPATNGRGWMAFEEKTM